MEKIPHSNSIDLSQYKCSPDYFPGSLLKNTLWRLFGMPLVKLLPDETIFFKQFNAFRIFILRRFGAIIGKNCIIRSIEVYHPWKITLGDNVWLGYGVNLYPLVPIHIGNNVCISQNAFLCTGSHDPYSPKFNLIIGEIILEDGSWVGANTFIGPNVTIHRGAVAGAGSVVTRNLPEMTICAGNPCKPVKKRVISNSSDSQ